MGGRYKKVWVNRDKRDGLGEWDCMMSFTLFVSNIPDSVTPKFLWEAFEKYGRLVEVFIPTKKDCRNRRFGFVRFKLEWEAYRAVKYANNMRINGSKIRVSIARYQHDWVREQRESKRPWGEASGRLVTNFLGVTQRSNGIDRRWVRKDLGENNNEDAKITEGKDLLEKQFGVLTKILNNIEEMKILLLKISHKQLSEEKAFESSTLENMREPERKCSVGTWLSNEGIEKDVERSMVLENSNIANDKVVEKNERSLVSFGVPENGFAQDCRRMIDAINNLKMTEPVKNYAASCKIMLAKIMADLRIQNPVDKKMSRGVKRNKGRRQ